tara:strand:- start:360 stop:554 length:195 start_codon:yes stop_codon:yes gene_type:complete
MKNKEKLKKVNLLLNEMKVFVAYLEDIHKDLETRKSESEFCDRPWGAIKNRAKSFRNSLLEFYR